MSAKSKAFSQPQFIMRSFAQDTGGLSFVTTDARELNGIYGKIATELAQHVHPRLRVEECAP